MAGKIALKRPVKELVAEYNTAVTDIRRACALIHSAEQRLNKSIGSIDEHGYASIEFRLAKGYIPGWDNPERPLEELRKTCWRTLIERLELHRYLSISAFNELEKQITNGGMPEITERSVTDVVKSFATQMDTLLAQSVTEVYDWLTPRIPSRERLKTNQRHGIPQKIIIERIGSLDHRGRFSVAYYYHQHLTALENVFTALAGQGQVSKSHYSALQLAIEGSEASGLTKTGETPYFSFKAYGGNGNLHLTFLREDLLLRFNKIAAGNRLSP